MNKLAQFLGAQEPLFDRSLEQLEDRSGKMGVDAKLIAEIAEKVADRTKQLKLTAEASAPELYSALTALVKHHDEHLAKALGGQDPTNIAEMIPLIIARIKQADLPRRGFFLKLDKAKAMLAATPPPAIMARLGYGDVTAMLEEENIYELFLALRFAEEPDWLNAFDAKYAELAASDFEERDVELVLFSAEKWGDVAEHFIAKKKHNITHSKELGAIAVMPMTATHMRGITLKVLPLLAHYYNEIHLYSAYFKLLRTKANFGEIVARTLIADTPKVSIMAGQTIHWRVIQRYYGKLPNEHHPEIFQPHLQPEDLHWRRAEDVLYQIDPELDFWRDLDYVGVLKGDDIISFNLMDVSLSYSNETPFDKRELYHFRESLWNEIFARYLGRKVLEDQLLNHLDNELVAPEKLV